jgi:MFS family permease
MLSYKLDEGSKIVNAWMRVAGILFVVAWGGNQFTPLLVMYQQTGGLTEQTATLLLGAYVFGLIPALLIGGPLSDRYGRRPLVLPAPFIAAAGSVVLALAESSPWILAAGRILSGVALGLSMAAGSSWVKELSDRRGARGTPGPKTGSGARRASLAITAGLGTGAATAAGIAQYAPLPGILPYIVNAVIAIVIGLMALTVPETVPPARAEQKHHATLRLLIDDLKVPAASRRRFLFVVAPVAPWVFGTASAAYAILPSLLAHRFPGFETGFSGILCLVALGCGFVVQPLARRFESTRTARSLAVALGVGILGVAVAAVAAATLNVVITLAAAAILGAGYGLLLISGLVEIQRIADAHDLAGLTGVYYSLTYVGFLLPAALSELSRWFSYSTLFGIGVVVGVGSLVVLLRHSRTDLPRGS